MRALLLPLALLLCVCPLAASASGWLWTAREEPCELCMRGVALLDKGLSGVGLDALVSVGLHACKQRAKSPCGGCHALQL